jgi:hypothetical protein
LKRFYRIQFLKKNYPLLTVEQNFNRCYLFKEKPYELIIFKENQENYESYKEELKEIARSADNQIAKDIYEAQDVSQEKPEEQSSGIRKLETI